MLGRTVLEQISDGGAMTLDVRSIPAGAYFVKVPSKKGMQVHRVTVVR